MRTWCQEDRIPHPILVSRVREFFSTLDSTLEKRPVFLGELALAVGYSIDQTQRAVNLLIESDVLREVTRAEKEELGYEFVHCLYVSA